MPRSTYDRVPDFRTDPEAFMEFMQTSFHDMYGFGTDVEGILDLENISEETGGILDRQTHIGEQATSTVTGLDEDLSDLADHIANVSDPHNVTAAQVGNGTAQWNADKIQGVEVDDAGLAGNTLLVYKTASGKLEYVAPTGALLPIPDSNEVISGSVDPTKLLRFEVDGFTTATTRVVTPLDKDYTLGDFLADGTVPLSGVITLSGDITPSQFTADQDDANPAGLSTAAVLRLSSDASRNVTGLQGGSDGRLLFIHNIGSFDIVLTDEDANSSAANRFDLNADVTIQPSDLVILQYDSTSSRWRAVAGGGGGGGGVSTWVALTDTASSFSGKAGQAVVVNAGETALEIVSSVQAFDGGAFNDVYVDTVNFDGGAF